jgi:hypothetical protein
MPSYFTIDSSRVQNPITLIKLGTLTAHFECILYDGLGNTIHLTKGRISQLIFCFRHLKNHPYLENQCVAVLLYGEASL